MGGRAAVPTISVAIPTYQRRGLVLDAIASVLAQGRAATEILVVDDGSTDGTSDAVADLHGDAVQLIRQPNRGPSAARNAAIGAAQGDVVAFLDSDNLWVPSHLGVVAELFTLHPAAALVGTQRNYAFGDDAPGGAALVDSAEDLLLRRLQVGLLSSVAVRRDALEAAGGFDEQLRYGEDAELFMRLALQGPFALISATTFVRGEDAHSLLREGQRGGGYIGLFERCADSVLAALDHSSRADADDLRAAARAHRALGAMLASLAGEEPVSSVRQHLDEIRRWAPGFDADSAVLGAAEVVVPGWDSPARRQRLASTLLQASTWPPGPGHDSGV
jgi:glycosyltransferase involved in cell wall biosynthesis